MKAANLLGRGWHPKWKESGDWNVGGRPFRSVHNRLLSMMGVVSNGERQMVQ